MTRFIFTLTLLTMLFLSVSALADPCADVQRELTFGETAVEMANDKAGFLKAAEEFEKATQKAPLCSAAYFNLGVVLEKTEQFSKAKQAFETYLGLVPDAEDAQVVNKKIYRLEYLIDNYGSEEFADETDKKGADETIQTLTGQWILDDGYMKFAYIITPEGSGGALLEFDRCLSNCGDFRSNPVNRYRLQLTGDGSLSGTHESQWAGQACAGRTFQAPVEAFLANDQRSLIIKVGEHTRYNTYYCRYEQGNAYSLTLTR